MDIRALLDSDGYIILDGAMGTELQKRGMKPGELSEEMNFSNPRWVAGINRAYAKAGSNVVFANTFGANRYKLKGSDRTVFEVVSAAVKIAKDATFDLDVSVALDVGPLGKLLEPSGELSFEEAYDAYAEIVKAGQAAGADLIVLETMTDLYELKAALLAAKENTNLPVFCSISLEKNMRTFTGTSVIEEILVLSGLGADAVGINCSLGPCQLESAVRDLVKYSPVPVFLKPNAGLPDPKTGKYDLSPEDFARQMAVFADMGVKIMGGCCGTSPEYVSALSDAVKEKICPDRRAETLQAVCSASKTVYLNMPRVIGERINPTGKKLFKEALRNGDIDYILARASEQVAAGAEILDVNVGLPEIDEKEMMVRVVKAVQGITDAPLQLDSTDPEVLEAALRVYNGCAIVNSVNGKEESLSEILPIVKKYGAAVVGLTLDENGIPEKAEDRFEIARKIAERAEALGIPREKVVIDCLTLTVSAQQAAAGETLRALSRVKGELGLRTVLGVSNISFGLPDRECINRTFLAMALEAGLDLAIINPNISSMTDTVRAFRVLGGFDVNAACYIAAKAEAAPVEKNKEEGVSLGAAIEGGLKKEAVSAVKALLESLSPLEVIDSHLIPVLDAVGEKYESGKIYLPQLILAADTAGVCFGAVKEMIASSGEVGAEKGRIVIATVEGDVHDIGKNIVKVLLENYGFSVTDLGKDVPAEKVLEAVEREGAGAVFLSALMTTTLPAMEKTASLLREKVPRVKVAVGGAVLTPEYAKKMGADFYGKDAKAAVDIAKRIFKE
ncbi:MAG: homocysteine methyltransferase [Ruminococcaceae bacterium]|nr:homocysteine methyltransferase [Oscillospiraceae bacterium]